MLDCAHTYTPCMSLIRAIMEQSMELDELDQKIKTMPQLPSVVMELIDAVNKELTDLATLEEIISKDPVLSAKVLSIANSPFYGLGGQVSNIGHACMVLGFHTIKNIVTAVGAMSTLDKSQINRLDLVAQWQRSMNTAVASKIIAKKLSLDQDGAFVAALLHDIGELVLDIYYPEKFEEALEMADKQQCTQFEAEETILGFDHAIVGSRLATYWNLPKLIVNAIEYHHRPNVSEASDLAAVIFVAEGMVKQLPVESLPVEIMNKIKLKPEELEESLPEITEAIKATTETVSV